MSNDNAEPRFDECCEPAGSSWSTATSLYERKIMYKLNEIVANQYILKRQLGQLIDIVDALQKKIQEDSSWETENEEEPEEEEDMEETQEYEAPLPKKRSY